MKKNISISATQPSPHKGGNTIELPPWKKGWHRRGLRMCVAPLCAVPHFPFPRSFRM